MTLSEFRKEEYWLIKWPIVMLALSLCLCGGLLVGLNSIDTSATTELQRARNELDSARQSVGKIEEEESTIIEYIGRYRQMEQDGVVANEDRLQLQETLAQLRSEFNLFPVRFDIDSQSSIPLQYAPGTSEPGRQIDLRTSLVEIGMPLLHEDDLVRLLQALAEGPRMLQPLTCSLTSKNPQTTSFIYLSQHFDAVCALQWYTFGLPPEDLAAEL